MASSGKAPRQTSNFLVARTAQQVKLLRHQQAAIFWRFLPSLVLSAPAQWKENFIKYCCLIWPDAGISPWVKSVLVRQGIQELHHICLESWNCLLQLSWTNVGLGRNVQAPVNLTTLLLLMYGIKVKDLVVYRQSDSKCLVHSDFCEKSCSEFSWS